MYYFQKGRNPVVATPTAVRVDEDHFIFDLIANEIDFNGPGPSNKVVSILKDKAFGPVNTDNPGVGLIAWMKEELAPFNLLPICHDEFHALYLHRMKGGK